MQPIRGVKTDGTVRFVASEEAEEDENGSVKAFFDVFPKKGVLILVEPV